MSDIRRAKAIIDAVLGTYDIGPRTREHLTAARALMDRERPKFTAPRELPTMTRAQVRKAIELRERGWSINRIAREIGTNHGRISEAINGQRKGI